MDAEFLNTPLVNYHYMQTVFGSRVATGRFAMGSNEPLGQPAAVETIDLEAQTKGKAAAGKSVPTRSTSSTKEEGPFQKLKQEEKGKGEGKRKRQLSEEDATLMIGMTDAIWSLSAAISEENYADATLGFMRQ